MDGQTDGRTDGRTTWKQYILPAASTPTSPVIHKHILHAGEGSEGAEDSNKLLHLPKYS